MISDIPMVKKVRPTGARKVRVRFAGDRREYVLDLTGLIARSRHFAPLMEDADTFAKIDIIDDGLGVAWPVETKWGHLDLSGSTLRRMAEEQLQQPERQLRGSGSQPARARGGPRLKGTRWYAASGLDVGLAGFHDEGTRLVRQQPFGL